MQCNVLPFNRHETVKVTRNVGILGCIWQLYLTLNFKWFSIVQQQGLPNRILSKKWPNTIHIMTHQNLTPSMFTFIFRHLFWFSIPECCSFCSKLELSPPHSMPGDRKSGQNMDPDRCNDWHQEDILMIMARWRLWGDVDGADDGI